MTLFCNLFIEQPSYLSIDPHCWRAMAPLNLRYYETRLRLLLHRWQNVSHSHVTVSCYISSTKHLTQPFFSEVQGVSQRSHIHTLPTTFQRSWAGDPDNAITAYELKQATTQDQDSKLITKTKTDNHKETWGSYFSCSHCCLLQQMTILNSSFIDPVCIRTLQPAHRTASVQTDRCLNEAFVSFVCTVCQCDIISQLVKLSATTFDKT